MPTSEEGFNPSDVFYIVGFTTESITGGSLIQLMSLSTLVLKSNEALWKQLGPLVPAIRAGKANRHVFEIYSINPFLFGGAVPAAIKKIEKLGGPYMAVEFFNNVAYNLCSEYQIQLPAVIGKTTRAELPPPPHLGITMRGVSYKRT